MKITPRTAREAVPGIRPGHEIWQAQTAGNLAAKLGEAPAPAAGPPRKQKKNRRATRQNI